jgi:hypothetical protein
MCGRRLEEVEEDTPEGFEKRKQLVELLVAEVTVGKKPEDSRTEVRITYRFGPPPEPGPRAILQREACLVIISRTAACRR